MTMLGNTGFKSTVFNVTDATAVGFEDMGFTQADIRESDAAHVSHISVDSSDLLYYWYNKDGAGIPKVPLSASTGGGQPEGHPIFAGGERIIRGIRNIANFRIIAGTGTVRVAVTLGSFGRGTT